MGKEIMDGCTAATYVAYALSDVATIYPITPVASMGETAQKWGMANRLNYAGTPMRVEEMESELGAAGATHGALAAGSLATTFTNSQGLALMFPNMFKMAGNMLPAVFHVGARSLATHALSIFGDHSDVMATRATGFAILSSGTVQETHDLAIVAHLASVGGSLPVLHFFDGWRTSNEMSTIETTAYADLFGLVEQEKVNAFRRRALNPEHPTLAGSAQNPDVYFQNSEASNLVYAGFPAEVQRQMDRVARVTGRSYHLFDYSGAEDAEVVIVAMGSACEVIEATVRYLNTQGYKAGVVKVRLYRPFSGKDLMGAIPATAKTVVTLDRTKEAGAEGEPLFKDTATAAMIHGRQNLRVIGGRYGLSSKDFNPAMVKSVVDEALKEDARRFFTVGINDDVTHLSLDVDSGFLLPEEGLTQVKFYGMGSDGTVGAAKQGARIIADAANLYAQAYFKYSAKKSGGYTISELRFGKEPVTAEYDITRAGYVACNRDTYVKRFRLIDNLDHGGIFVLNCSWSDSELATELPADMRRTIAERQIRFYAIDADGIAQANGLGVRVNMIMLAVFFHLMQVIGEGEAMERLRSQITSNYMHEGADVVRRNIAAIENAVKALRRVDTAVLTASSSSETTSSPTTASTGMKPVQQLGKLLPTAEFYSYISKACMTLEGDQLPVSAFTPDGHMPMGTTAFEKRRIARFVPEWDSSKCVECTECSLVCPHAAIRPFLLTDAELAQAPSGFTTREAEGVKALQGLHYRIQVYTEDCCGCGNCVSICPGHALSMQPIGTQLAKQIPMLEFVEKNVTVKEGLVPRFTINGSQFRQPLMQFSGACAGCGETPYVKLLTQLFGERMMIANATGCSSVWGANYPSNAYCARKCDGRGPAWGNSLFEDNAEYGYGMAVSCRQRREVAVRAAQKAISSGKLTAEMGDALKAWLSARLLPEESRKTADRLMALINALNEDERTPELRIIADNADQLAKKSVWAIGGDGWAYDIGFAGLDHVLASGEDINLLVLDTECYSNTGGQTSKATPLGAVTKYSPSGKRTFKKDLGRMMMTYGTVYVAQVALGANYQQTIDALREAEAYPGPSIVIAYCPCINHGIRAGMGHSILEEKRAVEAGYWPLYRFNPMMAVDRLSPYIADSVTAEHKMPAPGQSDAESATPAEQADMGAAGEGPWVKVAAETRELTVDYPATTADSATESGSRPIEVAATLKLFPPENLQAFLDGEDRYADIRLVAPQSADRLRSELSMRTRLVHMLLNSLSEIQ